MMLTALKRYRFSVIGVAISRATGYRMTFLSRTQPVTQPTRPAQHVASFLATTQAFRWLLGVAQA